MWLCLLDSLDDPGPAELSWLQAARARTGAEAALLVPFGPSTVGHIHRYRRCAALTAAHPWIHLERGPAAMRRPPKPHALLRSLMQKHGVRLVPVVPPGAFAGMAGAVRAHGGVILDDTPGIRRFVQSTGADAILLPGQAPRTPQPQPPALATVRWSTDAAVAAWERLGMPTIPRASLARDDRRPRLGQGNAAWVSGKVHPERGPVAVKTFWIGEDNSRAGAFLREASAFSRLAGAPGVVRCFGGYVEPPRAALVLERGLGDLQAPDRRVLADAAEGLAALHAAGLTHRDIRAENVLRMPDGSGRLMDLGIAGPPPWPEPPLAGAPWRQAPEVIVDIRSFVPGSDVFSFGTLIAELLTGGPVWPARSEAERVDALAAGERPPLPGGPLAEIVAQCWARWPEDRPSAAALAALLRGSG